MGINYHTLREACKLLRDQAKAHGEAGKPDAACILTAALTLTAGVTDGMTNEDRVGKLKEALWLMEGPPPVRECSCSPGARG